jgi:oligopeptide/dipeptide ABC transporter ATP-binding protein
MIHTQISGSGTPAQTLAAVPVNAASVLTVKDLYVRFDLPAGSVRAVQGIGFELKRGETMGIVGESGSGKSVSALAVLGLIPRPPGIVSGTRIGFAGRDLLRLPPDELRRIRGNQIAMIFQEPMSSLNPVFTIGTQIAEAVRLHLHMGRRDALDYAVDMLAKVGIPLPARRIHEYPHHLSGGMRQRVMIAMALACKPQVLLADEPTTALDVTIQAQIIDLLLALQEEYGTSILLISHDMGLVAETCDRVAVMYAGQIVEEASVEDIFASPRHPYTAGLLQSIPRLRTDRSMPRVLKLQAIGGVLPSPMEARAGCAFKTRCAHALDICATHEPALETLAKGHAARCWLHQAPPAPGKPN